MEQKSEQAHDLEKSIQRRVGARVDQLKDGLIDLFVEEPFY